MFSTPIVYEKDAPTATVPTASDVAVAATSGPLAARAAGIQTDTSHAAATSPRPTRHHRFIWPPIRRDADRTTERG
jgi:hypothetical protein